MQPSPTSETSGPPRPRVRLFMISFSHSRWRRTRSRGRRPLPRLVARGAALVALRRPGRLALGLLARSAVLAGEVGDQARVVLRAGRDLDDGDPHPGGEELLVVLAPVGVAP